jgi:hypothetical protein
MAVMTPYASNVAFLEDGRKMELGMRWRVDENGWG